MPIVKLSKEEKNKIINKHKQIIDEFNSNLPSSSKLEYDKDLETKLEDQKNVKYYYTLKKIENKLNKQNEIYRKLIDKFGDIPQDKLLLARSFMFGLKTENTKEADIYNERLYMEYQTNPEKVFYKRYKQVLEFDPQELLDVLDDKQKLADFYLKHQAVVEDAYVFSSTLSNSFLEIPKELKAAIPGLTRRIEDLSIPIGITKKEINSFLTFPELTQEQALNIIAANPTYLENSSPFKDNFNLILNPLSVDETKQAYNKIVNNGYTLGKDFYYRYVAIRENEQTHSRVEIPLDEGIENINNPNITVRERTSDEIFNLKRITKTFDNEFFDLWKKKFSKNYNNKEFNLEQIKDDNKGGVFERIFGTTSTEYKNFITAFEEFFDSNSPNYLNKNNLKTAAVSYFDHKIGDGISFNKIDKTGKERLMLVSATLKTINDIDNSMKKVFDEIDKKIFDSENVLEIFLDNSEVEDIFTFESTVDELDIKQDDKSLDLEKEQ